MSVSGIDLLSDIAASEPVKLDSVFSIDEVSFVKQPGSATVTAAKAFAAWLDAQKEVDSRRKTGATGYRMADPS